MTDHRAAAHRSRRLWIGLALVTMVWGASTGQPASADQDATVLLYYQNGAYTVTNLTLKWKPPGEKTKDRNFSRGMTAGMHFCFDVHTYNKNQCRQHEAVRNLPDGEKDAICNYPAIKPEEPEEPSDPSEEALDRYQDKMKKYQQDLEYYELANAYAKIPDRSEMWIVPKIDTVGAKSCKKDGKILYSIRRGLKEVFWLTEGTTFGNNRCKKAKSPERIDLLGDSIGNCDYYDYR